MPRYSGLLCLCIQLLVLLDSSLGWSPYHSTSMKEDRSVIVQLFEWRFDDIAEECTRFLGPYGYGGVQVSPVIECPSIERPNFNTAVIRPWWERYQPVSTKIFSRSGDEAQMAAMIDTCNKAGVRIYVDMIANHMTGSIGKGKGLGGSYYDSTTNSYPAVPYTDANFNNRDKCGTASWGTEDWSNKYQTRDCQLSGLHDLDQSQEHVRERIADMLNRLVDLGVAGFRMDASKHMWPQDLEAIFSRLHDLNTTYFAPKSKPFMYHELIYTGGGQGVVPREYTHLGRVLDFQFKELTRRAITKDHGKRLKDLYHVGPYQGDMLPAEDSLTIMDNHDEQRAPKGDKQINLRTDYHLKLGTAFMLAWPYGVPKVMSSYLWDTKYNEHGHDANDWIGPPADENYNIKRVPINADMTCGDRWLCEHRWREIYSMVGFRNAVGNEPVENWWDNDYHQIAFSRGRKGFLAMNNDDHALKRRLQTGLPQGTYCDVISGSLKDGKCTGKRVTVGSDGFADIEVENNANPILALHVNAKLN